jgi:hypothetical protein
VPCPYEGNYWLELRMDIKKIKKMKTVDIVALEAQKMF